jgi:E3 ubiquitin-protein ligase HECTD1
MQGNPSENPCAPLSQTGVNGAGKNYISLSGFEVYGAVTRVTTEQPGKEIIRVDMAARVAARRSMHKMVVGARVARGLDWKWESQDGEGGVCMAKT